MRTDRADPLERVSVSVRPAAYKSRRLLASSGRFNDFE